MGIFTRNHSLRGIWQNAQRAALVPALLLLGLGLLAVPHPEEAQAASFSGGVNGTQAQVVRQNQQARAAKSAQTYGTQEQAGETTPAAGSRASGQFKVASVNDIAWRMRILDVATVSGPVVRLGEIAVPVGEMPEELWRDLAAQPLWDAPAENSKAMSLSRPKLQQAMLGSMGRDFAMLCFYPQSLTLQRGGSVLGPAEVMDVTVKTLTPLLAALPGEASLSDFRLPETVFLGSAQQKLELETPARVEPGRLSLKFAVRDLDGSVVRRFTGTVFVDCWALLPCAAESVSKDETLEPSKITFIRKNLAQVRVPARQVHSQTRGTDNGAEQSRSSVVSASDIWDGKGGPWRTTRAIQAGQPILVSDLTHVPTISKGSTISLIYNAPSVRLSVRAEALADGVRGESVLVRNMASSRQVYATVIDEGTAVIESGFSRATAGNFRHAPEYSGGARAVPSGGGL